MVLWLLNITTLGLLATLSAIFLATMIKVPAVANVIAKVKVFIDTLAVAGVAVGIIGACAMPILIGFLPKQMFIYMFSNLVLVVMSLPYMLHKFEKSLESKTNAAILGEIRASLGWITKNEQIVGFLGAAAAAAILIAPLVP